MFLDRLYEYVFHEKMPHLTIKCLILLWEHDGDLVDEIDRVGYLTIIEYLDRIIARDLALDDSHTSFDICDIGLLFERYTISIVKKSPTRNILKRLCIYESIGNKNNLSSESCHLGIVERDLLDESLVCDIGPQLYSDDLPYIKCSR